MNHDYITDSSSGLCALFTASCLLLNIDMTGIHANKSDKLT